MTLKELKPRKALNKAFLKVKPNRTEIEGFKTNLIALLDGTNASEGEEFHKNLLSDFLKDTYYKQNHFINTKGRNDLVIHNGANAKSSVGVIIEAKRPTEKTDMVSKTKLNCKAFQELVLYYLRERITHKNLEVKFLIVTNINEWFIFDAMVFDRLFAQNKRLVKEFNDFEARRLADIKTDFFYKQIAEPFIEGITSEIEFTYFNIQDYQVPLRNDDKADDNKLIALFKLLSPEHLLKLPFSNDSNSLDKRFYSELLHIIGLTETKEGSKKIIDRNKEGQRNSGSLLEDAIIQLDSMDKLSRLDKPSQYGATTQERLFAVALELCITWVNRILFLKLLEAQLITYNTSRERGKAEQAYSFLNLDKIKSFDDLNSLFFQVLARKYEDRNEDVKAAFAKVPYLNSSLFEPTDMEQVTLFISNLRDDKTIPIISSTVLKNEQGKKRTGSMDTLEYLFAFLNAYDFSSEGSASIQEDNKTLINASVLGLIFEKINGYKDGSFFTPGFITMYMCRETIRKAVVQKFKSEPNPKGGENFAAVETFDDLYNTIKDAKAANAIINSIKICDPAVGSGHFLVSALNELIAVKNDLDILLDRNGKRLRNYHVEVVNDELIVTDEEGELFAYNPLHPESQRIQETLFHEKQTLIENCLFGVDINTNSVKICRLRLWIELLKNAYYTTTPVAGQANKGGELETLPNIDINIKCGNSLVSRFAIDADLKQALKKSKWTIDSYRLAVDTYRNANSKEQKREMERLIADIKSDFKSNIDNPFKKKISSARGKVTKIETEINTQKNWGDKVNKKLFRDFEKAVQQLKKLEIERDNIEMNVIYDNAFEWRFEFPEVLNDDGDFVGFDVIIGNPPYGLFNKKQNQNIALITDDLILESLKGKYPEAAGGVINAARIFLAFSYSISAADGFQCMIIPYGILTDSTSTNLRKHIFDNHSLLKVDAFPERDNAKKRVFEDVKMSTAILLTSKTKMDSTFDIGISYDRVINRKRATFNSNDLVKLSPELVQIPLTDSLSFKLLTKIYSKSNVYKFGVLSPCLTGEIDMTFGKPALSMNSSDNLLLKGVQLDRFIFKTKKEQISQGEIEYVDIKKLSTIVSSKKLQDATQRRIALQGLTGVNESRRLKATIVNKNTFLANSCNYILKPEDCELELILGFLNSKLLNFVFKTRSTSSNVNGYEVDNLPFVNSSYDCEIIKVVQEILLQKTINITTDTTALESQIDQLVYQLYDLTEEEIAIIEL